jgi:hypothetical protein
MRWPEAEVLEPFPACGFRARRWMRFERDLYAWLDTRQGQFAVWCAREVVAPKG